MMARTEPNHVVRRYRPFVMVPVEVLDAIIDPVAITVYLRLRQHADQYGEGAHPSRQRLAGMIGQSTPRAVDKAIARLVELGLVDVFHRYRTNSGEIVFAAEDGAAQTSNGFIIYDVPGDGAGSGTVPAPPEAVSSGIVSRSSSPSPQVEGWVHKNAPPPVHSSAPPPCTNVHPPRAQTCTQTRSLELDPVELDPPSPPQQESDEVEPIRDSTGEVVSPSPKPVAPGADAPGDVFAAAAHIMDGWERSRSSSRGVSASWRRQLAQHVGDALRREVPREVIVRALEGWDDGSSLSPGRLPHLIGAEERKRSAESSSAAASRAEAARTAAMLDEMNAGRVEPGSVDTTEFMRRALSPEAWARRQARLAEEGKQNPPPP